MELRHTNKPVKLETREDGTNTIVGYGAVFHRDGDAGTEYELFKGAVERIGPTAFDRAVQERHDARGLFNHDSNFVLGRVGSGTMRVAKDDIGLRYEIDLPDTQQARDVAESVRRGDVSGSSFAFLPTGVEWSEGRDGEPDVRTITDVDLYDVGPVTFPAYEATSTGARSYSVDAETEYREWRSHLGKNRREALKKRVRAELVDKGLDKE